MELIILEEYMKLNNIRKLNIEEEILLEELVHRSIKVISPDWKNGLLVASLEDGGMGSLALFPCDTLNKVRHFGSQVSECQFRDTDGVSVVASLYLDEDDKLYELDMWKVDFSKLIKIPTHFEDVEYSDK